MISSYSKVWNVGHRNVNDIFDGVVHIFPKIDGSQGSFGVLDGRLFIRSKNVRKYTDTRDKLFHGFCKTAERLFDEDKLNEGWVYRGEVLSDHKHNTLRYDTVPQGNFILFDVEISPGHMLLPDGVAVVAEELGLMCVPCVFEGEIESQDQLEEIVESVLANESILGGPREEGVVIKNYNKYGDDKKIMMAKVVREDFREENKKNWSTGTGVVEKIIDKYNNPARWNKAIQTRRDNGELDESPRDIGPLMGIIAKDVYEECADDIKEMLFKHYWKQVSRGVTRGFPEWYKDKLGVGDEESG